MSENEESKKRSYYSRRYSQRTHWQKSPRPSNPSSQPDEIKNENKEIPAKNLEELKKLPEIVDATIKPEPLPVQENKNIAELMQNIKENESKDEKEELKKSMEFDEKKEEKNEIIDSEILKEIAILKDKIRDQNVTNSLLEAKLRVILQQYENTKKDKENLATEKPQLEKDLEATKKAIIILTEDFGNASKDLAESKQKLKNKELASKKLEDELKELQRFAQDKQSELEKLKEKYAKSVVNMGVQTNDPSREKPKPKIITIRQYF